MPQRFFFSPCSGTYNSYKLVEVWMNWWTSCWIEMRWIWWICWNPICWLVVLNTSQQSQHVFRFIRPCWRKHVHWAGGPFREPKKLMPQVCPGLHHLAMWRDSMSITCKGLSNLNNMLWDFEGPFGSLIAHPEASDAIPVTQMDCGLGWLVCNLRLSIDLFWVRFLQEMKIEIRDHPAIVGIEAHIYRTRITYTYIYIITSITCFTAPTQCFQVFYMCAFQRCCARFRDVVHVSEMLCTFPSSCAQFAEVAHVSQKLCTFLKPPFFLFVFSCIGATHILPIHLWYRDPLRWCQFCFFPQEKGLRLVNRLVTTCERDVTWHSNQFFGGFLKWSRSHHRFIYIYIPQVYIHIYIYIHHRYIYILYNIYNIL